MHALETSLAQAEADRRQLKDKVSKLQLNDSKVEQEKEAMRSQIENAESRITRIDLKKRGVEGTRTADANHVCILYFFLPQRISHKFISFPIQKLADKNLQAESSYSLLSKAEHLLQI